MCLLIFSQTATKLGFISFGSDNTVISKFHVNFSSPNWFFLISTIDHSIYSNSLESRQKCEATVFFQLRGSAKSSSDFGEQPFGDPSVMSFWILVAHKKIPCGRVVLSPQPSCTRRTAHPSKFKWLKSCFELYRCGRRRPEGPSFIKLGKRCVGQILEA